MSVRRTKWLAQFRRIIMPVLNGFANQTLKTDFIPQTPHDYTRPPNTVYVEAFCRVFMSVAPLFEHPCDDTADIRALMMDSWAVVIDQKYLDWSCGDQLMVEAANLVYGFLLYPKSWNALPLSTQSGVLRILQQASTIKPVNNNWILFKCCIDLFLFKNKKLERIAHVYKLLDDFEDWYVGDSWYKDGPSFHMDYYNSFVILPFLFIIYNHLRREARLPIFQTRYDLIVGRIRQHAEFLERLIGVDGSFPLFGRSLVYRSAVFHTLMFCCVHVGLPPKLTHGQVRCAIERVHDRLWIECQFDARGFLNLGFMGATPAIANHYSNNGSCYFTGLSFLVLGCHATHPFWAADDAPCTQEIIWKSKNDT